MKKLVVIRVGSITHLLHKDMRVTGEGAEVEAEDVVVAVAADLPLKELHKSRLAWPINYGMRQVSSLLD